MAGITKFAATLSRITILVSLLTAASFATPPSVNAAPVSSEDQITLLGPVTYQAPLIGSKTTTNVFSVTWLAQTGPADVLVWTGLSQPRQVPILSNPCGQGSSQWRMGIGCQQIIQGTRIEGVYDAKFMQISEINGHLDHVHIEVYD